MGTSEDPGVGNIPGFSPFSQNSRGSGVVPGIHRKKIPKNQRRRERRGKDPETFQGWEGKKNSGILWLGCGNGDLGCGNGDLGIWGVGMGIWGVRIWEFGVWEWGLFGMGTAGTRTRGHGMPGMGKDPELCPQNWEGDPKTRMETP